MAALTILTSPNIASLQSTVVADLCSGYFSVDISDSIYIGSGEENVLGAKVQITNPYGVVVRAYPSDYDVTPGLSGGMDAVTQFAIPTLAGNYQYGNYIIETKIYDADGTTYSLSKTVSICAPDSLNKTRKYGTLSAKITGICREGKVYILVDGVPNYKGKVAESQTNVFVVDYPSGKI